MCTRVLSFRFNRNRILSKTYLQTVSERGEKRCAEEEFIKKKIRGCESNVIKSNQCDTQFQRGGSGPTMKLYVYLIVVLMTTDACWSQCRKANWWGSFDKKGWSTCGLSTEYLTGFYRNNRRSDDPIFLLEEGMCCKAPSPNQNRASTCTNANWWGVLDR